MKLEDRMNNLLGILDVQVEGFFTERFINLCKINKIKIWNIKNVAVGIVTFCIAKNDYYKLKDICKKTKCEAKIINKKGLYFKAIKYKGRSMAIVLLFLFVTISVFITNMIWKIEVEGNECVRSEEIIAELKNSGLDIGKSKFGLDKKRIINELRINLKDIAWAGIEFDGSKAIIKVVEKTRLDSDNIQENVVGDIISNKAGIINKITVENGTQILNVGEYVEEGRVLIEGKIYSKFVETKDVVAKGKVILNTKYYFEKYYPFVLQEKEYYAKDKYSIGFEVNEKENYINYLAKSVNYDIIKKGKSINLFGKTIGFNFYIFKLYELKSRNVSKDEIYETAMKDVSEYIQNVLVVNSKNLQVLNTSYNISSEDENGMNVVIEIDAQEEVGYFRERK